MLSVRFTVEDIVIEPPKPKMGLGKAKLAWAKAGNWAKAASKAVMLARAAALKAEEAPTEEQVMGEEEATEADLVASAPPQPVVSSAVAWARALALEANGQQVSDELSVVAALNKEVAEGGDAAAAATTTKEGATAEEDKGKAATSALGWTPPEIKVRLVELADVDQVAVRIDRPTGGDGELSVTAQPTPVFDVVLSRSRV